MGVPINQGVEILYGYLSISHLGFEATNTGAYVFFFFIVVGCWWANCVKEKWSDPSSPGMEVVD